MTPVERLEAAIAKLERLRAESPYIEMGEWLAETYPGDRAAASIYGPPEDLGPVTNDALLVTLHRTIDAQLDLLRFTRAYLGAGMTGPDESDAFADLGGALADAILGDNS